MPWLAWPCDVVTAPGGVGGVLLVDSRQSVRAVGLPGTANHESAKGVPLWGFPLGRDALMHLAELLAPSRGNVTCFVATRRPVLRKVGICWLGISSTCNRCCTTCRNLTTRQ